MMKRESPSQPAFVHLRILVVLVLFFAGSLLALLALGFYPGASASAQAPRQNQSSSASPFQPVAADHISWGGGVMPATTTGAVSEQPSAENLAPSETASAQPVMVPTRSSFMASWKSVTGAAGYRLDVSTSPLFKSFVNGYENLDVGDTTSRIVSGLSPGTNYYYRVRSYNVLGTTTNSEVMTATTLTTAAGLVITPTFDSSITGSSNSAAIQSVINQAIAKYQSQFKDAITVSILFRYARTAPNGTLLSSGVSRSDFPIYFIAWSTFITALKADAKTANDTTANASLPASALSTNIVVTSANGKAVGLGALTPLGMCANGSVAIGCPYDGIVTLNAGISYSFTRPPSSSNYDAQRQVEHETDEVLGLGSFLNLGGSNLRPQDLFSWSAAGVRNRTSSGTRYFSINSGTTNIVNFNQTSGFDFGDWLSSSCPQAHPYVQNAFVCPAQFADVTASSPEGINLDVIGYDLVIPPAAPTAKAATNITTTSFTANWSSVSGATSYLLDVSTSSTFSTFLTGYQNLNLGTVITRSVSGLSAGKTYYYRVRTLSSAGTSGNSNVISVTTVPAAPVASAATNITTTSFTAHWSSVSGATSYLLDVSTSSTFSSFVTGFQSRNVGNVTSFSVTGLTASTTYYYRVRALGGGGTSTNSNVIKVATVPLAKAATNVKTTSFTANWSGVTGATSYQLDVSTSNTFSSFVTGFQNRNVGTVTSFNVTGLTAGTTYYYRMRVVSSSGTSANSNVISVATVPLVPTAKAATNVTTTSFTANWGSVTGATSYQLDVSTSSSFSSFVTGFQNRNVGTVTSFNVTGLTTKTTYFYRVRANDSGGTSVNSNVVSVKTL
jgi:phosphodiesterase/alkaline phosphatase D-like protein